VYTEEVEMRETKAKKIQVYYVCYQ